MRTDVGPAFACARQARQASDTAGLIKVGAAAVIGAGGYVGLAEREWQ
jgi:hypothetical protein